MLCMYQTDFNELLIVNGTKRKKNYLLLWRSIRKVIV